MNYKRVFTFGCSFTNWIWPTWADVIAVQTGLPVYNGALAGIGNVGISCRILEYDLNYNFNEQDLILVMWSSWSREDRYINNRWQIHGSVFNNSFYDQHFLKKYWSWENDIIKNASAIISTNRSFNISDNYTICEYGDVERNNEKRNDTPLFDKYKRNLPSTIVFNLDDNSRFNGASKDDHPDILSHVKFYNDHISEKFNFTKVKDSSCFHHWQRDIVDLLKEHPHLQQDEIIKKYFKDLVHLFSKT